MWMPGKTSIHFAQPTLFEPQEPVPSEGNADEARGIFIAIERIWATALRLDKP